MNMEYENEEILLLKRAVSIREIIESSIYGKVETEYEGRNDRVYVAITPDILPNLEFEYQIFNISKKILLNHADEDIVRNVLRSYDKWIHSLVFKKGAKYGFKPGSASTGSPSEDA